MEAGGPLHERVAKRPRRLPPANTNTVQLPKELIIRICGFIKPGKDRWVVLLALLRSRHGPSFTELDLSQKYVKQGATLCVEFVGDVFSRCRYQQL